MKCKVEIPEPYSETFQKYTKNLPMRDAMNTLAIGVVATFISFAFRKLQIVSRFRESDQKCWIVILAFLLVSGLTWLVVQANLSEYISFLIEPFVNNALGKGLTCLVGVAMPHAGCIKRAVFKGIDDTVSGCSKGAKACSESLKNVTYKVQGQIKDCMAKKRASQAIKEEKKPLQPKKSSKNNSCADLD